MCLQPLNIIMKQPLTLASVEIIVAFRHFLLEDTPIKTVDLSCCARNSCFYSVRNEASWFYVINQSSPKAFIASPATPCAPTPDNLCSPTEINRDVSGCFSIFKVRTVGPTGTDRCKMERHFLIKRATRVERSFPFCIPFPNSPRHEKRLNLSKPDQFVKNETVNFGPIGPTGQSAPPPEVVPNIPVTPNRNGPFHLTSDRNFRNIWLNWKHPLYTKETYSRGQKDAPRVSTASGQKPCVGTEYAWGYIRNDLFSIFLLHKRLWGKGNFGKGGREGEF